MWEHFVLVVWKVCLAQWGFFPTLRKEWTFWREKCYIFLTNDDGFCCFRFAQAHLKPIWTPRIHSILRQEDLQPNCTTTTFCGICILLGMGELELHTVSSLWGLMDLHYGIRLFSNLFLVPLLIIANVLFAVLLLLSIELPTFWNYYSPSAHSSVVITSSGPIILYAKLGKFSQWFALHFSLLCCSVLLSPSLHSALIFTTPNNLMSAHFITSLLTVNFALQYFYRIMYDYVVQLYFHASSQGRKMSFLTVKTLCVTPAFFFPSSSQFFCHWCSASWKVFDD